MHAYQACGPTKYIITNFAINNINNLIAVAIDIVYMTNRLVTEEGPVRPVCTQISG